MAKYHIGENGPKPCTASAGRCKYGSKAEHFSSLGEAEKIFQQKLREENPHYLTGAKKIFVLHPSDFDQKQTQAMEKAGISHGDNIENIEPGSLVFPRHRAIPFSKLVQEEIEGMRAHLINSSAEHEYISDSTKWRGSLRHGIPYWSGDNIDAIPHEGPFFVKGETNALKNEWGKYCYAPNKEELAQVVENNKNNPLLQNQKIIVQPFLKFKKLGKNNNNGQPVINEWRYFTLNGEIMGSGFYWSQQKTEIAPSFVGSEKIVKETLEDIGNRAKFVAIDVAELESGEWKVIELNDGNMSGLCGVNAETLWQNISKSIKAM